MRDSDAFRFGSVRHHGGKIADPLPPGAGEGNEFRMSMDTHKDPNRGQPSVEGGEVSARLAPPLLRALDAWIAAQPEPRPPRPEAVRRLLAEALGQHVNAGTIAGEDLNASNDE